MTGAPGEDALDGIKIRERGRLYVSMTARSSLHRIRPGIPGTRP